MLGEFILDIVFKIVSGFFSLMPAVSWNPSNAIISFLSGTVSTVCYLLPMGTVVAVVGIIISVTLFRIVVSFLKTIWDVLPIV